jgi:hypothetical protein
MPVAASTTTRPQAQLVHSMPGRARLRFAEQRGDEAFFESLKASLEKQPGVIQVRPVVHTGSVLLLLTGELAGVLAHAEKKGLFDVLPPPPPTASLRKLRHAIDSLDDRVAKETGDTLTVGKLVFLGLVGAGIFQSKQGHLWPAGLTLFKHALELMDWVADREPVNSQHRA